MKNQMSILILSFLAVLFGCGQAADESQLSQFGIPGLPPGVFPPGDYLLAIPAQVQPGQAVTLSWNAVNATVVEIVGVAGNLPPRGSIQVSPPITTTYTLRAYNSTGSLISRSAVVEVGFAPSSSSIEYFWTSHVSIKEGEAATLNWQVRDCRSTFLEAVGRPEDSRSLLCGGALEVRPKETTQYILRAYDRNNNAAGTKSLTVIVTPAVTKIDSFVSSQSSVALGGSVTISWSVSNATRVEFSGAPGQTQPSSGSITIRPEQTSSYTLTAFSAKGESVTSEIRVEVYKQGPEIKQFVVDQTNLEVGQQSVLRWDVTNCASVQLLGGVAGRLNKTVGCSGSIIIKPEVNADFSLTALGLQGETLSRTISVKVSPAPTIEFFYSDRSPIKQGESVNLYWKVENASNVKLSYGEIISDVPLAASTQVTLGRTTIFTLKVTGLSGRIVEVPLTVDVQPLTETDLLNQLLNKMGASTN